MCPSRDYSRLETRDGSKHYSQRGSEKSKRAEQNRMGDNETYRSVSKKAKLMKNGRHEFLNNIKNLV